MDGWVPLSPSIPLLPHPPRRVKNPSAFPRTPVDDFRTPGIYEWIRKGEYSHSEESSLEDESSDSDKSSRGPRVPVRL